MFAHEAKIAMSAAEAALVVVDGVSGVGVVTEKVCSLPMRSTCRA